MLLLIGLLSSVLLQNLWSTLMMTSAQVVEASISTTDTSPSQDYPYLEDQTPTIKCHSPIRIINCNSNICIVLRFENAERLLLSSLQILNFPFLWVHPGPFIPDKELLIVYHRGGGEKGVGWFSSLSGFNRDQRKISIKDGEGEGWGYWNTAQLQSLIGGQVSFIVNQHSSELPYPPLRP